MTVVVGAVLTMVTSVASTMMAVVSLVLTALLPASIASLKALHNEVDVALELSHHPLHLALRDVEAKGLELGNEFVHLPVGSDKVVAFRRGGARGDRHGNTEPLAELLAFRGAHPPHSSVLAELLGRNQIDADQDFSVARDRTLDWDEVGAVHAISLLRNEDQLRPYRPVETSVADAPSLNEWSSRGKLHRSSALIHGASGELLFAGAVLPVALALLALQAITRLVGAFRSNVATTMPSAEWKILLEPLRAGSTVLLLPHLTRVASTVFSNSSRRPGSLHKEDRRLGGKRLNGGSLSKGGFGHQSHTILLDDLETQQACSGMLEGMFQFSVGSHDDQIIITILVKQIQSSLRGKGEQSADLSLKRNESS